jgi:hypothetical protein
MLQKGTERAEGIRMRIRSRGGNRFGRALRRARAAINALVGVDRIGGTFENRFRRARILAAAATDALVGSNLVSHFFYSFV